MAELATLARPYANAVFEFAKEEGRLELWSRTLAVLVRTLQEDEVQSLVASPIHSPAKKAITLTDILGDQLSDSMLRFVHVLAENRRLELLPEIQEGFEAKLEEEQRTLTVEMTTAVDLTNEEKTRFTNTLQQRFQRDISLATEVDPNVLGGALIRAGDTVLDGTVRGKLEKLRNQMQRTN
ncbi:MAG: F0F1 ATP synthase subunit delta [Gammaproteobacteria bacterium]|nr:F0F1 ATP synthase subunit delta [Gammaproteobacteria bacterium]